MDKEKNTKILRQELKYVLGRGEYAALCQRCTAVMQSDPHTGPDGTYNITSLYFDDLGDTALLQNYSGVSRREKFRIRLYNNNTDTLHLEKKVKIGGVGTKYACPVTRNELESILAGDLDWMRGSPHELMRELYVRMTAELLRPKTIVSYRRRPFIYAPGNVRVTFDYDLRSGICSRDMLSENTVLVPAAPGQVLMEVKYDAFLPDIIRIILQEGTPRARAFSKYAACRQYDI